MKKAWIVILALALSLALTAPAFADGETEITTTVLESYTLTIPADAAIALNATSSNIGSLAISDIHIASGKKITVTASSPDDGFILKTTGGEIDYTLTIDGVAGASTDFTANGTKAVTVEIAASEWAAAPAGAYTDTITFTSSVVDAS